MTVIPFEFARERYPLAPHTLYRIGGPARLAMFPRSGEEVEAAYQWLTTNKMPFIVLGGGSNVLIDDRGYPGCALFTTELRHVESLGEHRRLVGAGVALGDMVRDILLPNNYVGVGALTGIPGTVGGALFMNAGTVNGSICQFAQTVRLLTPGGPSTVTMTPDLYAYRGQTFCGADTVIVEGVFHFTASEKDETETYRHYQERRRNTQPQGWCCGSVFKNPEGDHAGRLIEAAGLKGLRHGGAVISDKHANFIMNENNATFSDILYLINHIKRAVAARFDVELREEVRIIQTEQSD